MARFRNEMARRDFVRLAAFAAAAFAAGCKADEAGDSASTAVNACVPDPDPSWVAPSDSTVDLPHLGGAPDTNEGRCIAAFCDAVIPGAWRDPEGAPGAIDVGAPALFFDPDLPALAFVPVLVAYLDGVAQNTFGAAFASLTPDERDAALDTALQSLDLLGLAIQLAKLGFFSSEGAACYLGYPGPNEGYVDDPDFSFGVAMSTEITVDGNLD